MTQSQDTPTTWSHEGFQLFLETVPDAMLITDVEGKIRMANELASELFGRSKEELIGSSVESLMPARFRQAHVEQRKGYIAAPRTRPMGAGSELFALHSEDREIPVEISLSPVHLDDKVLVSCAIRDVTERMKIQADLQVAKDDLERTVEERTAQLVRQESLAQLGQVTAAIAHDIKNPLAGISGALQLLRDELPEDDEKRRIFDMMLDRVDLLVGNIDDTLAYSRPLTPQKSPRNLLNMTRDAIQLFQRDPAVKNVAMTLHGRDAVVDCDAGQFESVVTNILKNASEAMQGRGEIDIRITEADGRCKMTFRDTGPGIPPQILKKIFDPFFTTKRNGTGLGLATARRIVEAHGGTLEVQSPSEGGTCVTMELPLTA